MALNRGNGEGAPTQLEITLRGHNIPVDTWTGEGGTKTLEDLLGEIESGESRLETTTTGKLRRTVRVVAVNIVGKDKDGQRYRLEEDRQVFKEDGHVKRRRLHGAVAEKIKGGESAIQAARRGIREELRITTAEILGEENGVIKETGRTATYPGLETEYRIHVVHARIGPDNFNMRGYVERQKRKTTHFKWVPLEN